MVHEWRCGYTRRKLDAKEQSMHANQTSTVIFYATTQINTTKETYDRASRSSRREGEVMLGAERHQVLNSLLHVRRDETGNKQAWQDPQEAASVFRAGSSQPSHHIRGPSRSHLL